MRWTTTVEERTEGSPRFGKGRKSEGQIPPRLGYHHQGGNSRQTAVDIISELRQELRVEQMEVVREAILNWALTRWGRADEHQYRLKKIEMPQRNILLHPGDSRDPNLIPKMGKDTRRPRRIYSNMLTINQLIHQIVDGRERMCEVGNKNSMSNYIGNFLSVAFADASVIELKQGSISEVADKVHAAISKVTTRDHFLDLIDWIECHRPWLMLLRVVLGQGGPALVFSSGRRFPVAEVDFRFGSPVLGTVCSIIERIGVAYLNQRPSASGDGSWTISAILWPELAAALEFDSILQPMSAAHLQL
ncbi:hypothetical protein CJ030_MR0G005050 [Morella rubra]|uniref:Uncharacterized protein n=1 Tax=Morella rubra TaxID=262757 RepID=A0A6A1ULP2_9ROSI|nr:hypothetical protein CJ030_MR0G005050 [Morella rubra]